MKLNSFQDDFHHYEKNTHPQTKIISFEKRAKKAKSMSKRDATAKIISFPSRYRKAHRLKNCKSVAGTLCGSCGGLFGIIIFILILALLFVI